MRYDARGEQSPTRPTDAPPLLATVRSAPLAPEQRALWGYLEGSRREAEGIADNWQGASIPTLLAGTQASKAALERAPKFGTAVKLPAELRRAESGQPAPTKHWAAFVVSGAAW